MVDAVVDCCSQLLACAEVLTGVLIIIQNLQNNCQVNAK